MKLIKIKINLNSSINKLAEGLRHDFLILNWGLLLLFQVKWAREGSGAGNLWVKNGSGYYRPEVHVLKAYKSVVLLNDSNISAYNSPWGFISLVLEIMKEELCVALRFRCSTTSLTWKPWGIHVILLTLICNPVFVKNTSHVDFNDMTV